PGTETPRPPRPLRPRHDRSLRSGTAAPRTGPDARAAPPPPPRKPGSRRESPRRRARKSRPRLRRCRNAARERPRSERCRGVNRRRRERCRRGSGGSRYRAAIASPGIAATRGPEPWVRSSGPRRWRILLGPWPAPRWFRFPPSPMPRLRAGAALLIAPDDHALEEAVPDAHAREGVRLRDFQVNDAAL